MTARTLMGLAAACAAALGAEPIQWAPPSTNGMRDLSGFLEEHRRELALPALAAAVVRGRQIAAAGVTGERKSASGVPVQLGDKFHIGSCTKSMTALLAAELAREGLLTFETRVGEVFPEWELDPEKGAITLEHLLQNRSGIGNQPDPGLWRRAFDGRLKGSPQEQRKTFLQEILRMPLEAPPGTKYIYSNPGFALAGALLEARAGRPWEDLMREKVFGPLQLASAGFGPPSLSKDLDQPWGHRRRDGEIVPLDPHDNPVAIAPAGLVHLSILDLARYAAFHRDFFAGQIPALRSMRERFFTPPAESAYAYGWLVQPRDWAGGPALTHTGSNTMFFAVIWIAPVKDYAFIVATNLGDRRQATADQCDRVVAALIKQYLP